MTEYYYLPKKYHKVHSACFELVRQIEEFITVRDYEFLKITTYPMTEDELDKLNELGDLWDFLKQHKEDQFYNLLNKQIINGLLTDFCYFMQESLECSKKMRLVVTYAMLRRPLVDNLKILLRILADNNFYNNFINKSDYDPASMKDEDLKTLLNETDKMRLCKPITGELIYDLVFDKDNGGSIINLSNRAIHPVTTRPWNKTGEMDFNFMFATPPVIEGMWDQYYRCLPVVLIFYSELFNTAIFGLFKDEVKEGLFEKRIKKLVAVMNNAFDTKTVQKV